MQQISVLAHNACMMTEQLTGVGAAVGARVGAGVGSAVGACQKNDISASSDWYMSYSIRYD